MAAAIAALLCTGDRGVLIRWGRARSQYAACSLAANMQAMKKIEQVIFANWIPSYGMTNIFNPALTNIDTENLEMPVAITNVVTCTNYTTVTLLSTNPPYLHDPGGLCLGVQRPGNLYQYRRRLARSQS